MAAPTLAQLVAHYRTLDTDPTAIAVAVGDYVACKMVAAWPRIVLPAWTAPKSAPPSDDRERWRWIWTGYIGGPDEPIFVWELARASGVPEHTARLKWGALMANRLVYPDGTLPGPAQTLLRAFVGSRLPPPPKDPDGALRAEIERLRVENSRLRKGRIRE